MKGFNLIKPGTNIPFVSVHRPFFLISLLLVIGSVALFSLRGMNFGIDFQGGIVIEVRSEKAADIGHMRSVLGDLGLGEVSLQEFGAPTDVMIRVQRQEGGEKAQQIAVAKVKETLGDGFEYRRTEFVGPKVSEELFWSGLQAVGFAILAILIYIWFRFEWQFGMGAVVALVHDILSTIGLFAITQMEFNLSTVAAVLTIAGYSINDTVVVYDRVRENLRRYKSRPLPEVLNISINETLSRTVMTSVTTLLALLALYFLGGEVIRGFSIALIWGIVIGTYSSIFLAVPLMLYMNLPRRSGDKADGQAATEGA
ncbi:protein translocase subunit SecF [Magnetospira sp. QH-2]|uniref:protein translocase subunit SecF n=1 Tax=Magnetospira sp. (strain QH-2) TaxID=1288970 RepID=UPI0003E80AF0|nr:protein translocase subunit SecF [Magnetospira sp. QH-2]CCQ73037.1 Protein-export membrane protein secF [Magnetospira sp. QH-2]